MDFKFKDIEQVKLVKCVKDSATVIEEGDLVALSSGLIIKAVDGSTAVAFCPNGAAAGVTEVEVTVGNDFTLVGTASGAFAVTDKGTEVDLVVETGVQHINLEASSTDVFKVDISENAGTAGSASNVIVRINKPLF